MGPKPRSCTKFHELFVAEYEKEAMAALFRSHVYSALGAVLNLQQPLVVWCDLDQEEITTHPEVSVEMTLDLFNRITLGDRDYWANSMVTTFTDTFKTEGPEANLVLRPANPRHEDTRILGDIRSFSWRASRLLASGRELSSDDDWSVLEVALWVTNISQDQDVRNTIRYPNYHTVITFPIVGRRGDVLRVMRSHGGLRTPGTSQPTLTTYGYRLRF